MRANTFTVYGEPSRQYQPKDFKLYGGAELEGMTLIAEVKDSVRTGSDVKIYFKEIDVRYYKLVVTDTWATKQSYRYIAFRTLKFSYSVDGGKLLSPDEDVFNYKGNWSLSNKLSTFGHLYEGQNATLEFEFTGSRFAIFSYEGFEVLIDGISAYSVSINGESDAVKLAYLSKELTNGKHVVTVRGKTRFNVDSIALWN